MKYMTLWSYSDAVGILYRKYRRKVGDSCLLVKEKIVSSKGYHSSLEILISSTISPMVLLKRHAM